MDDLWACSAPGVGCRGAGHVMNCVSAKHVWPSRSLCRRQQQPEAMSAGLGIPVKLLHESLGHIVTVELKTGQLYRGKLAEGG